MCAYKMRNPGKRIIFLRCQGPQGRLAPMYGPACSLDYEHDEGTPAMCWRVCAGVRGVKQPKLIGKAPP